MQLLITLHSSIIIYVEQQYHNFTESPYPFVQVLSGLYERIMLEDNALFVYADNLTQSLEQVRKNIFTFDNLTFAQEKNDKQNKKNAPANKDSQRKKSKHNTNNTSNPKPKPKNPPISHPPKDIGHLPKDSEYLQTPPLETPSISVNPPAQTTQTIPPPVKKPPIEQPSSTAQESYTPIRPINNPRIPIDEGSSVLLIGDSMMQGVAPYVLKTFKKVNLRGINLSKHSTGLTTNIILIGRQPLKILLLKTLILPL